MTQFIEFEHIKEVGYPGSVKQEKVYRYNFESIEEVEAALTEDFEYYNNERLHQSFGYLTPADVFYGQKIPG